MKIVSSVGLVALAALGGFGGGIAHHHFTQDHPVTGRAIEISNESGYNITHVFAKPHAKRKDWGEELLGEDIVLASGRKTVINLDDETRDCKYDLRAVLSTKERLHQTRVDLCGTKKKWHVRSTMNEILPAE